MSAPAELPLDEFKALAQAGDAPTDVLLRKAYTVHKRAVDEERRTATFTITTGAVDRDRDTIDPRGVDFENFRRNPVVLFAHRSRDLPIGRAESIREEASAIKARTLFVPGETYAFAETVFQLVAGGFLNAASIGFQPKQTAFNEARRGYDFQEVELLEFSIVPVPANPEALLDAKEAGIDVAPLKAWAERILDEVSEEPGMWVPKHLALKAFEILQPSRVVVPPPAPDPKAAGAGSAGAHNPEPATTFFPTADQLRAAVRSAAKDAVQARVTRELGRLD